MEEQYHDENFETKEPLQDQTQDNTPIPDPLIPPAAPPMQRFDFTPVMPVNDRKPASKGLKIFALLLSIAILITGACAAGYYVGRYGSDRSPAKRVEVDLASKPKDTDEMTAGQVYEAVKNSVAGIMAYDENGNTLMVSGVFFSEDGYLVTNDHIYQKISEPKFIVYTADGKEYDAEFVAGDATSDLTVLKIKEGKFKAATFGNSDEMFCGENMVVMENICEAGNRVTVTKGTVTSTGLRVRSAVTNYSQRLIITDTAVLNNGSGGALVNMYGQVVGLTSYSDETGICYSVPSKLIKRYVEDMIANGRITTRAKLGITYQYINAVMAKSKDYERTGAMIDSVASDSDLNGKIEKGDIITGFNDVAIESEDQLLNMVEDCAAKQKATLTVIDRSGEEKTVEFVLGANIGESSYQKETSSDDIKQSEQNPDSGGTFNFPRGE